MLETTENKIVYVVTGEDWEFYFNLRFNHPDELHVCLKDSSVSDVELTRGVDFTVEEKNDYSYGAVVTLIPTSPKVQAAAGKNLVIRRVLPVIQELNLPEQGKLPSTPLELELDKIIMICQQFKEELARCIKVSLASGQTPEEFMDGFLSVITGAKDVALQASVSAANAAASASGSLALIGQIMAELTGDDRYRTQTFDILERAWQAKGAIEGAAAAALGDLDHKVAVSIAAVNTAAEVAQNAAEASIQANVSSAIVDANTTIAGYVNAAIGADEVFSSAFTVACNNLNAVVVSALGDVNDIASGYVSNAVSVVSGAIDDWNSIYSAASSMGSQALADIASARLAAYNTIAGQLGVASAYVTSGGSQLDIMAGYLSSVRTLSSGISVTVGDLVLSAGTSISGYISAGSLSLANVGNAYVSSFSGYLDSGGNQLSSMGTILGSARSVLSDVNSSVGVIYSSAGSNAQNLVSLHNLSGSAHAGVLAPLASPALTGTPTAPTATAETSSTQIATTAFTQNAKHATQLASCDLNTVTTPGTYFLYYQNTYTNSPLGAGVEGMLTVIANLIRVHQFVHAKSTLRQFSRTIYNGTATPWVMQSGYQIASTFTRGTGSTAAGTYLVIPFYDKDGNLYGQLDHDSVSDGGQRIRLVMHANAIGSSGAGGLTVGVNGQGQFYVNTTTPPADSDGYNIPTTHWIRHLLSTASDGVMNASLNNNGYTKLPNGLIIQWGRANSQSAGKVTVTLPITFPHGILYASSVPCEASSTTDLVADAYVGQFSDTVWTASTFPVWAKRQVGFMWLAIGY